MNDKLKSILIKANKDVFGSNTGSNLTQSKGEGLDFREIREYEFGDDIRKINWNATAKTSKTQVNVFNVDKELNIVLVFLVSGSIHFGSCRLKQDVIAEILAYLSYSSVKHNNRLSGLLYCDNEQIFMPDRYSSSNLYTIVENSLDIDCLGKSTSYLKLAQYLDKVISQKSLIFLVGDFYGDVDLGTLPFKHEIKALIVRDKLEEFPYIQGEYDFVSPFDYDTNTIVMSKGVATRYHKAIIENDKHLDKYFNKHKIKYGKIYTHDDVFLKLTEILREV